MSDTLNRRAPVGNTRSALALLGFLAACFAVAGLGSVITTAQTAPGGWFETLEKPFFSPPSWLFGPVWTILYFLIALSGWLVWRRSGFSGARVAMIHDSGRREGRRKRLASRFPEARVIIFGHSHVPFLEDEDGFLLLNPGSPTDKRRQPEHTFALLRVEEGEVRAEILVL